MSDERSERIWLRWTCTNLCLALAFYVGGYFALARHPSHLGRAVSNVRIYPSGSIARAYTPLAWIDASIRRQQVHLKSAGEWTTVDP
jgi:hypothetical protein